MLRTWHLRDMAGINSAVLPIIRQEANAHDIDIYIGNHKVWFRSAPEAMKLFETKLKTLGIIMVSTADHGTS